MRVKKYSSWGDKCGTVNMETKVQQVRSIYLAKRVGEPPLAVDGVEYNYACLVGRRVVALLQLPLLKVRADTVLLYDQQKMGSALP